MLDKAGQAFKFKKVERFCCLPQPHAPHWQRSKLASWKDAASGSVGAVCLTYSGLPFDTLKVRAQTGAGAAHRGALAAARQLVAAEGPLALWRGGGPALCSALLDNTTLFALQRSIQRWLAPGAACEAALTPLQHALCGGAAGFCAATAICPAELIKCRMQAAALRSGGSGASASGAALALGVLRREGPAGLFRGWAPLVARDVPLQALFFASYQVHSAWMQRAHDALFPASAAAAAAADAADAAGAVPSWRAYLAGGAAGSTAWLLIFPLDVIKSRMQVEGSAADGGSGSSAGARLGMRATARALLREGGVAAFYKGLLPAVVRAFPANAALLWGVELATWALKDL